MARPYVQAMSSRLFIEACEKKDGLIQVKGDTGRYVKKVLRLKKGDSIIICTADGMEHHSVVAGMGGEGVLFEVRESVRIERESPLDITLCQALPKGKKMDIIIQKGTELGVKRFIPVISSRSVSRPGGREGEGKIKRWGKIALEASRQSGRGCIPSVEGITTFEELLAEYAGIHDKKRLKLIPWESEKERKWRDLTATPDDKIVILIGPEGGFSCSEVENAAAAGFIPLSLGPRLLRTETAGPAVVSILQFLWGDMG